MLNREIFSKNKIWLFLVGRSSNNIYQLKAGRPLPHYRVWSNKIHWQYLPTHRTAGKFILNVHPVNFKIFFFLNIQFIYDLTIIYFYVTYCTRLLLMYARALLIFAIWAHIILSGVLYYKFGANIMNEHLCHD